MKIKLLIIEDEAAIRDLIRFTLPEEEFILTDAEDTKKAIHILANTIPDIILLDWMLPGQSGIEFIQWIRKQKDLQEIPIIMLTAKAEEENKIKGLMTGADDYITKPFSPAELLARIRVALRRGPIVSPSNEIQCQDILLNVSKHQVTIQGEIVKLSPIEYKLLLFFMKHRDKTYTRDQLINHIWGGNVYIDDRTVDVQIRRLRDKLKKYQHHHLIQTVRGTGYRFSTHEHE